MANLISQMEQALNELKLKEAKIKEEEERLNSEKEWVAVQLTDKKIKLNIGGTYFTTTLTTLRSEPNSMLAAMFSGRFPIEKDQDDGAYFIDRNGRAFGYILDWLRTGKIYPKISEEDMFWLQEDASYYGISSLLSHIAPKNQMVPTGRTKTELHLTIIGARNLLGGEQELEPFVIINTASRSIPKDKTRTKVSRGTANLTWNENFFIPLRDRNDELILACYDDDLIGRHFLCECKISLGTLINEKPTPVKGKLSKQGEIDVVLTIKLSDKELGLQK